MAVLDDIFDILLPDNLAHALLKFTDRFKSQHSIVFVLAFCTTGFNAHVGQAGIRDVHQVQVSNYSPVPQNTVIAQPQMLFLVLDQQLDSPA